MNNPLSNVARSRVIQRQLASQRPEFQELIRQEAANRGIPLEQAFLEMAPRGSQSQIQAEIDNEMSQLQAKEASDMRVAEQQKQANEYLNSPDAQERYGMNPSDQELAAAGERARFKALQAAEEQEDQSVEDQFVKSGLSREAASRGRKIRGLLKNRNSISNPFKKAE
jgi:hypothetical protein